MPNADHPQLRNPPIVEAVFDFDCDLPPGFDLKELEARSRAHFAASYPKFQTQFLQEVRIETVDEGAQAKISGKSALQTFQYLHEDSKQLIQIRPQGFSFNRLAPYSTLDEYLPEIERTWRLYVDLVGPVQIRAVRVRYINRILVPMPNDNLDLEEFLKIGPRLPEEDKLNLTGFLSQQSAVEKSTGHQINLVLTAQQPVNNTLPIILDITVGSPLPTDPDDWPTVVATIQSLRHLKNRIFFNTLTVKCIELFQS